MIKKLFLTGLILFFILLSIKNYACTNFIVTKGASVDGSVMVSTQQIHMDFMVNFIIIHQQSIKTELG